MDIKGCIPKDKFDTAALERARQIGFPALNPILAVLLEWIQDRNWPVAPHAASLLSEAGLEILPPVRAVLNSTDGVWKYWTIDLVLRNVRSEVLAELHEELVRLADHPMQADIAEEVDAVARSVLSARKPT